MDRKTFIRVTTGLCLLAFVSCGHSTLRRVPKESSPEAKVPKDQGPVGAETADFPQELDYQEHQNLSPVRHWAVWVRRVGVDSFAGLGFLQNLESQGIKPIKVAGSGMGCWVALSWALRNRGNDAEWQAMKLNTWDSLEAGFVKSLGQGGRRESFLGYYRKIQSSQASNLFQIPLECPLFDKKQRVLSLARDLRLEDRLYKQFELPLLEFGEFAEYPQYSSGAMARSYGEDFLRVLNEDIAQEPSSTAWLVLETSANHRMWGSEPSIVKGVSEDGVRWIRIPVGQDLAISAQQLKDFRLRRRWLLEGRRDAKVFLQHPEIKEFLGL